MEGRQGRKVTTGVSTNSNRKVSFFDSFFYITTIDIFTYRLPPINQPPTTGLETRETHLELFLLIYLLYYTN